MTSAIVIRVAIQMRPSGLWVATSEELPGFMLTDRSVEQIKLKAPQVIKSMLEHIYKSPVNVIGGQLGTHPSDEQEGDVFVALPAYVAAAAMAACN
jgi:hypothetical protein